MISVNKFFYFAFVAALVVMAVMAVIPGEVVRHSFEFQDKVLHALAFAILAGLGLGARRWSGGRLVVMLAFFGALIEVVQFFVPWRSDEFLDWAADMVGVGLAFAVVAVAGRLRRGGGGG